MITYPADENELTKMRAAFRTKYEFAVERNVIEDGAHISRADLAEALDTLSAAENRVLRSRLRRTFRKLDDLTTGSRKTFDAPRATPSDLPPGVQLRRQDR